MSRFIHEVQHRGKTQPCAEEKRVVVSELDGRARADSIAGTELGRHPTISSSRLWVAFFAAGELRKVSRGAPVSLGPAPVYWGAIWTDDDTVLYGDGSGLVRVPVEGGEAERVLLQGFRAQLTPTGHLVFGRSSTLWAVPFDIDRLEISGEAVPVLDGVQIGGSRIIIVLNWLDELELRVPIED